MFKFMGCLCLQERISCETASLSAGKKPVGLHLTFPTTKSNMFWTHLLFQIFAITKQDPLS